MSDPLDDVHHIEDEARLARWNAWLSFAVDTSGRVDLPPAWVEELALEAARDRYDALDDEKFQELHIRWTAALTQVETEIEEHVDGCCTCPQDSEVDDPDCESCQIVRRWRAVDDEMRANDDKEAAIAAELEGVIWRA